MYGQSIALVNPDFFLVDFGWARFCGCATVFPTWQFALAGHGETSWWTVGGGRGGGGGGVDLYGLKANIDIVQGFGFCALLCAPRVTNW